MNSPLIHIGYHKTGTTWLQHEVFSASSSVFVPVGYRSKPKEMGYAFVLQNDGQLQSSFDVRGQRKEEIIDLVRKCQTTDPRIPVISNERLSGHPHGGGLDARTIADRIHYTLPTARILCIVREQCSALQSIYLQYVRMGGTRSVYDFLWKSDSMLGDFHFDHLDYTKLIGYYDSLFGRDKVLVLPYEWLANEPLAFLDAIGGFVGSQISVRPEAFARQHNKHRVQSVLPVTRRLNPFLCRTSLNGYSPLAGGVLRRVAGSAMRVALWRAARTGGVEWARQRLDEQIKEAVGKHYEASNTRLSDRLGIDLRKYGYRCSPKGHGSESAEWSALAGQGLI